MIAGDVTGDELLVQMVTGWAWMYLGMITVVGVWFVISLVVDFLDNRRDRREREQRRARDRTWRG